MPFSHGCQVLNLYIIGIARLSVVSTSQQPFTIPRRHYF